MDFIVVVGGGFVIDGVKYVVVLIYYDGDGWDILMGYYVLLSVILIGVVLIILVMGFEVNGNLVIIKNEIQEKLLFFVVCVCLVFVVMDLDVMKILLEC